MILKNERIERAKPIRVESVNTGRIWGVMHVDELRLFFFGRNKAFYKVMKELKD